MSWEEERATGVAESFWKVRRAGVCGDHRGRGSRGQGRTSGRDEERKEGRWVGEQVVTKVGSEYVVVPNREEKAFVPVVMGDDV